MALTTLSVVLTAVFLALTAYFTRATPRRIAGALAVAIVIAPAVMLADTLAFYAGLWRYPLVATPYGPLEFYVAIGLGIGALTLLIWRLERRFGRRALVGAVAFMAVYGPFRDYVGGQAISHVIEFGPGPLPVVADMLAWAVGVSLGVLVMRVVAGAARADRLARMRPAPGTPGLT